MDLEGQGNSDQMYQLSMRWQWMAKTISVMLWGSLPKAVVLWLHMVCKNSSK